MYIRSYINILYTKHFRERESLADATNANLDERAGTARRGAAATTRRRRKRSYAHESTFVRNSYA